MRVISYEASPGLEPAPAAPGVTAAVPDGGACGPLRVPEAALPATSAPGLPGSDTPEPGSVTRGPGSDTRGPGSVTPVSGSTPAGCALAPTLAAGAALRRRRRPDRFSSALSSAGLASLPALAARSTESPSSPASRPSAPASRPAPLSRPSAPL